MLSKSVQVHNGLFYSSTDNTKGLFSRGQHLISHIVPCYILPLSQETTTQKNEKGVCIVIIRFIKSFYFMLEELDLYFKRRIYLFFLTLASAEGIFSRQLGQ